MVTLYMYIELKTEKVFTNTISQLHLKDEEQVLKYSLCFPVLLIDFPPSVEMIKTLTK